MRDRAKLNGNEPDELFQGFADSTKDQVRNAAERFKEDDGSEPASKLEKAEAHVDAQLDKSIELSFPASDPIAAPPMPAASGLPAGRDLFEDMLDQAIELTFPASDPIAVSVYAELVAGSSPEPDAHGRAA